MLAPRPRPRPRSSLSGSSGPSTARLVLTTLFFIFTFGCLVKIVSLTISLSGKAWTHDIATILHTWGQDPWEYEGRTKYPTDLTRDIQPRPIHSHNDYWRQVPLFSALTLGVVSVEADVWEYDHELYVGHDVRSLSRNRTLRALYVDRIREVLDGMNERSEIPELEDSAAPLRGVFDTEPEQTLHLYVDLKTPGLATLPVVLNHLNPLREPRNYLTHWNGTHLNRGCVTVHLTGDTPFDAMLASNATYRDYFYDAPLMELSSGRYNTTNSLMSSTPFSRDVGKVFWGSGGVSESMLKKIREQIKDAHDRGIGVRYWSTPGWPISVRNDIWRVLVREGVDLLNVDDLKAAVTMEW